MKRILSAIILGWLFLFSPLQAEAVDLTFWTTEIHEDRIKNIEFLIQAFMVMQDDVSVRLVSVNENKLFERMQAAAQNGTGPDLVGAGSQLLMALCEKGVLGKEAVSDIVKDIGVDRLYPGTLNQLSAPGGNSWYGVPFHGWVQGIWYRADWFEKAGLAPPRDWALPQSIFTILQTVDTASS